MTHSDAPVKKRRAVKYISITLLVIFALAAAYLGICSITYSDGTRSGILTKVSRKGFIIKTYEGELNVGGLNQGDGTIMPASIFLFSVRQKTVYDELEKLQGRKVILHYQQVVKNLFWQGETDYFITAVRPATNL
jgi:hypothetical protein